MAKREDGKETRLRVLKSACDMFSARGFRKATVADICLKAGANRASINYYFGDKAGLYMECWKYAVDLFGEDLFDSAAERSPEEELRHYIHTLIKNLMDPGEKGHFSRLYMAELVNPTGLIQDAWYETIEPRRRALHEIITRIMGGRPDEETLIFCEMGIASQCRILLSISPNDMEYFLGQTPDPAMIKRLVDHVTRFSLAGIRAVGP
ncbi:MAG: CerR family C-terminal domain-containing protein [Desulfobacter sp.]|nr:MAG: CerR family C-terminal domain-containing protein [Desulfobacter sp.]